jgi:hypothetical protein
MANIVRIPGSKPIRGDMRHYLVVFEEPTISPVSGRAALVDSLSKASGHCLDVVRQFITEQHLEGDVGEIGEANAFGMIGIVGTPRLAEKLRTAPSVKAVLSD